MFTAATDCGKIWGTVGAISYLLFKAYQMRGSKIHPHPVSWCVLSCCSPSPKVLWFLIKCRSGRAQAILKYRSAGRHLSLVCNRAEQKGHFSLYIQWRRVHSSDGCCENDIHALTKAHFSSVWFLRQQLIFSQVFIPTNNIPSLHASLNGLPRIFGSLSLQYELRTRHVEIWGS